MCGRYALNATATELIEHFKLLSSLDLGPRFNIAPTSQIPVIRHKPDTGRVAQLVRWGLIPSWAKDPSIGAKLNNARAETVAEKPSFRTSFARHRCIIPASGFYEWQTVAGKKQPFYIHPTAPDTFFAFAGLLAAWKAPDGQTIVSTCIITTAPNAVMEPIHDRMPVILQPEQFDVWLDQQTPGPQEMLKPCNPDLMNAYPVRPLKSDGPECIEAMDCRK